MMNFSNTIKAVISVFMKTPSHTSEEQDSLTARLEKVQELCGRVYTHICQINQKYANDGTEGAAQLSAKARNKCSGTVKNFP